MITSQITIRPHLAEYLYGKYNNGDRTMPIRIPSTDDLYHLVWMLVRKRPINVSPRDDGNVSIALEKDHIGKSPLVYNYLDEKSAKIIDLKIEALFFLELHSRIDENNMTGRSITTIQVIHAFMCDYEVDSISEDALVKNYYRWQDNIRKRQVRRRYRKTVKKN